MKLQFEGRIDCVNHIYRGVGGEFKIPMDPKKGYSIIYLRVGRDEVIVVRPMNSRRLREWQGRKSDEEIKSGNKVRFTIEKLVRTRRRTHMVRRHR
jgi:hypothetical protein